MPPPRTSIILRDPARLAVVLRRLQRAGRPVSAGHGYEELTLRGFARAIGISAPSLLALTRGSCGRMRFLTYLKLRRYVRLLFDGAAADCERQLSAAQRGAKGARLAAVIREVNLALAPVEDYSEAARSFYRCVDKSFAMPSITTGERERLEAIVDRQPRRRFLRVRRAEIES